MQLTPTVHFAALTPAQKTKIALARDGEQRRVPSPSQEILDRYIPNGQEPSPSKDFDALPSMDDTFANELITAMGQEFENWLLGPLPERTCIANRKKLAGIVQRLDEADFTVPEKLIDKIVWAYKNAPAPKKSSW